MGGLLESTVKAGCGSIRVGSDASSRTINTETGRSLELGITSDHDPFTIISSGHCLGSWNTRIAGLLACSVR